MDRRPSAFQNPDAFPRSDQPAASTTNPENTYRSSQDIAQNPTYNAAITTNHFSRLHRYGGTLPDGIRPPEPAIDPRSLTSTDGGRAHTQETTGPHHNNDVLRTPADRFVQGSSQGTARRDVYPSAPPAENTAAASSSSRPLDRPTTTRRDTSDAPQPPRHGYSLDRLKTGLATNGRWDETMAAHIRTMGGLSHEEVTALRTELKAHYPDSSITLTSMNYDSNYASHYSNITSLTKRYLDYHLSPAVREHINTNNQQTRRQFGGRAKPGERW
jgi:hypothetical protein